MATQVTHHSPAGLPRNPAFSQAVSVQGPIRTIYVGGQNAVEADGTVTSHDLAAQTVRALRNLELVLADAGARLADVASWSILVVAGQPLAEAFAGFQQVWGTRGEPPAITVAFVVGLANPQVPGGGQRRGGRAAGSLTLAEPGGGRWV